MQNLFKEFICELIGTAILMLLGVSGCACSVLTRQTGVSLQCGFAYAFGVVIASVFAGPVSGAHINPAVTIAFSTIGKFKWRKVPVYIVAQYLGSFIGCFIAWSIYFESIQAFDTVGNLTKPSLTTAGIFITLPAEKITIWPAIMDQVVSTALLLFAILFISDESIFPSSKLLQILTTGFVILTFIIGFNFNCGAILNPARDLSPRIMLWMMGYDKMPFEPLNGNFWWAVGIVGPHFGAIIGAIFYYYNSKMRLEYVEEHRQIINANDTAIIQTKSILMNTSNDIINANQLKTISSKNYSQSKNNNRQIFGNVNTDFKIEP